MQTWKDRLGQIRAGLNGAHQEPSATATPRPSNGPRKEWTPPKDLTDARCRLIEAMSACASIEAQLSDYSDQNPDWAKRARHAFRLREIEVQKLQTWLEANDKAPQATEVASAAPGKAASLQSELDDLRERSGQLEFLEAFYDVAQIALAETTFSRIRERANDRANHYRTASTKTAEAAK